MHSSVLKNFYNLEQPTYYEKISVSYSGCNGTYQSNDKYYINIMVNKMLKDKEFAYYLFSNCNNFGNDEILAEEKIIERLSIDKKENFLEYYE